MSNNNALEKEIGVSIRKLLLSSVPGIGQFIDEIFFELRSRIKQERLNNFVELLSESLTNNGIVDVENLKSEDFGDLLESVLKRVVQTKSKEKHKRFRDVLLNYIKGTGGEIEHSEILLDLISSTTEIEIKILYQHKLYDNVFDRNTKIVEEAKRIIFASESQLKKEELDKQRGYANNHSKLVSQIEEAHKKRIQAENEMQKYSEFRMAKYFALTEDEYLFYKQILFAKGLIVDTGMALQNNSSFGYSPFSFTTITQFGKEFIEFILEENQNGN